ncbi:MAG TPA: hypothetical protein VK324_16775 [Tepidisphaeraceae bacterium]|nr:hypothetical protein [Tepidisphaeraceae bacterium]
MAEIPGAVQLIGLRQALKAYVTALETQSARHIKPLHWYIANRLVIEGGFRPEEITPRPPFRIETTGSGGSRRHRLVHDASGAGSGEQTVLGGVKTKQVDVVVAKERMGPCLAVSVKGTVGAFRNLTNRMEEAIGDCTNLHISYPTLVYGFLHVIRATTEAPGVPKNDVAVLRDGSVVSSIRRYHDAMAELTGRKGVRNDYTRYEAVALALVTPSGDAVGDVIGSFPLQQSRLLFTSFFQALYATYDHRYVYAAPDLRSVTERLVWADDSPALPDVRAAGHIARTEGSDAADEV